MLRPAPDLSRDSTQALVPAGPAFASAEPDTLTRRRAGSIAFVVVAVAEGVEENCDIVAYWEALLVRSSYRPEVEVDRGFELVLHTPWKPLAEVAALAEEDLFRPRVPEREKLVAEEGGSAGNSLNPSSPTSSQLVSRNAAVESGCGSALQRFEPSLVPRFGRLVVRVLAAVLELVPVDSSTRGPGSHIVVGWQGARVSIQAV